MPWTRGMLMAWVGRKHDGGHLLDDLVSGGRIVRIDGAYTHRDVRRMVIPRLAIGKPPVDGNTKLIVTDEMLKRYGFNL